MLSCIIGNYLLPICRVTVLTSTLNFSGDEVIQADICVLYGVITTQSPGPDPDKPIQIITLKEVVIYRYPKVASVNLLSLYDIYILFYLYT